MKNFKCGLTSVSFRDKTIEDIIAKTAQVGLDCIELGSDVHAKCDDKENLKYIKKLCYDSNIKINSYGTYFRFLKDDVSEINKYISASKALSTDIIRVWCGDKGFYEYSEDELYVLVDECKKAAEIAQKNNVTLCLECHNNTATDCKAGILYLMNSVNSPNFQMYWQPNQFKSEKENIECARECARFTKCIHIFNWNESDRFPLIQGKRIWKEYLKSFDGSQAVLLEFMPDNDIKSLDIEAKSLFEIIGEV